MNKYHLDRRAHRYRRARRRTIVIAILIFFIALIYFLFNLNVTPTQNIQNPPAITRKYQDGTAKSIVIDKPEFTLRLPEGWTEYKGKDESLVPPPTYIFLSPPANKQTLRIYLGAIPEKLAINKAITVSARGNQLDRDVVSENCANFTGQAKRDPTGNAPAKWQNIDFICDLNSPMRPIVGAISTDGMNMVKVKGAKLGEKNIFISYGDFNINPNYVTLYDILDSIRFK